MDHFMTQRVNALSQPNSEKYHAYTYMMALYTEVLVTLKQKESRHFVKVGRIQTQSLF